ncbi:MAG: pitrilysin family protein [Candidatus Acidiferrales bacterium]
MKRFFRSTAWIVTASLSGGVAARRLTAQDAQQPAPSSARQNASRPDQKNGTGIVPPGVKLAPQMPAAAPAKPFHFPRAATKTLANGLRVFVVSDHREPAVAVRLVITSAGALNDPAGMPGVAMMAASLFTQGTEKRSAQQIAEAIDFVGGSLAASAGKDATSVTLDVVKKDVELGMDLMSDIVLHPAFKQEELDRQREQLLSGFTVQYSDPAYLSMAVFDRVVYRGSAYGLPDEGTPDSVKKFSPDVFVKFHDDTFVPNQALLALAGDITPEEAFAAAEKYFGGWAKKDIPTVSAEKPEPPSGLHFWLIDKPDAVQTQIRVGKPGVRRNSPDYIPLVVTNRIFGGGFNSRLNTEVRVNKGLTYGAFSNFSSLKYAGSFLAGTFTRTEATVEATKLVVDLVAKMSTGDVTPAEMNFARDYLAGVYPIQSETAEQVADRVLTVAEYGLPEDYNETYPAKIRAVSADQVKAMAARYFTPKDLDVVLAGNVSQFRDALKAAFPEATWEEVPVDQLDLLSADLRKPKEAAPASTAESLERGSEILKAAAEAAGGAALNTVESLEITANGKAFSPQGEFPIELKLLIAYPDKTRSEVKLPFGTLVQGSDGNKAWLQSPQGTMDLPADFNGEAQRSVALSGAWGLYKQVLNGKVELQSLGEEEVDGKKMLAVQWKASNGPVKLYFDPSSHLLVGAHFKSLTPQGTADTDQRWSDFRAVDGRQYPYQTVIYRNGSKFSETTVQTIQVNPKPDASVFTKPQ